MCDKCKKKKHCECSSSSSSSSSTDVQTYTVNKVKKVPYKKKVTIVKKKHVSKWKRDGCSYSD